jgi:hypothetical protein
VATVHPRFLVDEHQQPTDVVLTIDQWREILEKLEELEDIQAYDSAKTEPQDAVPLTQAIDELRKSRSA